MTQPICGEVSRRKLLRALAAANIDVRHSGGEAIVDVPGVTYLLGRNAVGPLTIRRLLRRLDAAGYDTARILDDLYGRPKGN